MNGTVKQLSHEDVNQAETIYDALSDVMSTLSGVIADLDGLDNSVVADVIVDISNIIDAVKNELEVQELLLATADELENIMQNRDYVRSVL